MPKGFQKGHKGYWTDERKKTQKFARYWLGKKRDDSEYLQKISLAHKGQNSSPATQFKATGKKAYAVVGGKNAYRNLHKWIENKLGKPDTCEHCGRSNLSGKLIHWSNKSKEYTRNLNDWVRLCVKCHYHYDDRYKLINN